MKRSLVPATSPMTRERMFEPLLQADPTFQPAWDRFLETWRDESVDLPCYLALSDLARHLTAKLQSGDTGAFNAVFDVVERWHVEGDDYVREAATIGLLEDLQNEGVHDRTKPSDFERWLRPISRKFWERVAQYWSEGRPILRD